MRPRRMASAGAVFTLYALAAGPASAGESLKEYAERCDAAIGVTVPDFNCDEGTLIPVTNYPGGSAYNAGSCDKPNRLSGVCDPNSRMKILHRSSTADVVALCRKKGNGAGQYGDIAVIQHNKQNGSTCFYQALGTLDGRVQAPKKGQGAWEWMSPASTAGIRCASCHDNGPFVRSPYLTQVSGIDALPGRGDNLYNKTQPYRFIGADFGHWATYSVETSNKTCTNCHRMGTNLLAAAGAALVLGPQATARSEPNKNAHSSTSPIWMVPNQITYSQSSADAATSIASCAQRRFESPLPNDSSCKIVKYSSTDSTPGPVPPAASYAQAEQINGTYDRLLIRNPTNQEYRQALWLLRDGGSQADLEALINHPQGDSPRLMNVKAGDNRADLVCHDMATGGKWADYNASGQFNTTGFDWQVSTNFCGHETGRIYKGDFNKDGLADLLCLDVANGTKWIDYANTSGQFSGTNWTTDSTPFCNHRTGRVHVGDFNGDGYDDLLCHDIANGAKWIDYANTSGQFNGTNWTASTGFCGHASGRLFVGDFNADGRDDLLCHDASSGAKWIDYADGSGQLNGSDWGALGDLCAHSRGRLLIGDFDGNGSSDLLCHDLDSGMKWIDYADFAGRFNATGWDWGATGDLCKHKTGRLFVGRLDDDSRDDLLCNDVYTGKKWIDYADTSGRLNSAGWDWGDVGDFCMHDDGELH